MRGGLPCCGCCCQVVWLQLLLALLALQGDAQVIAGVRPPGMRLKKHQAIPGRGKQHQARESAVAVAPGPPPGYLSEPTPEYTDEFQGSGLDLGKWHQRRECKFTSLSCQRPQQVSVSDGLMRIKLESVDQNITVQIPESQGCPENDTMDGCTRDFKYFGGGIISNFNVSFGYAEGRIRSWKDGGWWQAFWSATADTQVAGACEICNIEGFPRQQVDVCEINSGISIAQWNLIKWSPDPGTYYSGRFAELPGLVDKWTVWGVEYTPNYNRIWKDGVFLGTLDNRYMTVQELTEWHWWITAIITSSSLANMDETNLPGVFEADYFRWYDPDPGKKLVFPPLTNTDAFPRVTLPPCPTVTHTLPPSVRAFTVALWVKHDPSLVEDLLTGGEEGVPYVTYSVPGVDGSAEELSVKSVPGGKLRITVAGETVDVDDFWLSDDIDIVGWTHVGVIYDGYDLIVFRNAEVVFTEALWEDDPFKSRNGLNRNGILTAGHIYTLSTKTGELLPASSFVGELAHVKLFTSALSKRDFSSLYFCLNVYGDWFDSQLGYETDGGATATSPDDLTCPDRMDGPFYPADDDGVADEEREAHPFSGFFASGYQPFFNGSAILYPASKATDNMTETYVYNTQHGWVDPHGWMGW
uniref:GH16 domain-containing protein n=1 Tax=Vitrella brassicaformis TaxID=1169539 RepID=A0A7S1JNR1_9ALVE|mmetsp:Transcript_17478/g.41986  ORF Transcript_17478/g.41986 Transcript_17478/m.41986 type:complete len:639 (+) Transcript_17478:227-2143(+)